MKITKQHWEYVVILDDKEIYRDAKSPYLKAIIEQYPKARFFDSFDSKHKPETIYKFRTVKE